MPQTHASAQEEILALRQRLVELEEILGRNEDQVVALAVIFRLPTKQAGFLNLILRREAVAWETAETVLWSLGERAELKDVNNLLSVMLNKIRKQLLPHGIHIETSYKRGVMMTPFYKRKLWKILYDKGLLSLFFPKGAPVCFTPNEK